MRLCSDCGQVESHSSECGQARPLAKTPVAKNAFALERFQEAKAQLAEIELSVSSPREAILRVTSLEVLLERYPAGHLTAYADKRAHNDLINELAKMRTAAGEKLPAGVTVALVQSDWAFAKRSLELFYSLGARRADVAQFDPSELGKLPLASIKEALDRATPLTKINAELEQRIQEGKDLDGEVAAWGWKNLRRLMTGKEPAEIPPQILGGGGVSNVFGALVGRGPQTRRLSAMSRFERIGSRMRERLYVLGAHGLVLSTISRAAQAEDLWTRHLAKDEGAARWAKLKSEGKVVLDYFLSSPRPDDVEAHLIELATSSPARRQVSLRPLTELDGDEWDGLAKAYFFVFASIMAGGSSRDIGMEALARKLLERSRGNLAAAESRALVLQEVRDAWHDRPPREINNP